MQPDSLDAEPINEVEDGVHVAALSAARNSRVHEHLQPEAVVTLCHRAPRQSTHHHPLVDGLNYQRRFDAAVDAVRRVLDADSPVIVHCRAGASRSPTVLATALAAEQDTTFSDALDDIRDVRAAVSPYEPLCWHGRHYLGEQSIREAVRESMFDVDPDVVAEETGEGTPLDGEPRPELPDDLPAGLNGDLERHK